MGGFLSRFVPPNWMDGYDDGFDGRDMQKVEGSAVQVEDYMDGYKAGAEDRKVVDRDNSSNA
jgi:hypothetical protein